MCCWEDPCNNYCVILSDIVIVVCVNCRKNINKIGSNLFNAANEFDKFIMEAANVFDKFIIEL